MFEKKKYYSCRDLNYTALLAPIASQPANQSGHSAVTMGKQSKIKKGKKDKGLPSTVGQDLDKGLLPNAFVQVKLQEKGKRGKRSKGSSDEEEDVIASYEGRPRRWEKKNDNKQGRLPIKTLDGRIQQVEVEDVSDIENAEESEDEAWSGLSEVEESDGEVEEEEKPKIPIRQQIIQAKEELAQIAAALNEDPEENAHLFRRLREISESSHPSIQKLALATQLAVYKSTIPGYRIRPLTPEEQTAKVSKEVKKLRAFEQALIHSYQQYVEKLASLARGHKSNSGDKNAAEFSKFAISCACALLIAVPHFNFRGELLKIIVERLSSKHVDEGHIRARETLEELFRTDGDGTASLDAVRLLVKMLKARHYNIDESVLNTFLSLRLLTELSAKASTERVDREDASEDTITSGKKRKRGEDPKKAFKTKRAKKLGREQKAAMQELKEADAIVSHEEREKMQAETLKLVFVTYFKILKDRPGGRNNPLMAATLEGLAKFAHLVNIEFFTMLLTALKELIQDSVTSSSPYFPHHTASAPHSPAHQPTRETLLCITTAFALLTGQSADYNPSISRTKTSSLVPLDLTFFTSQLYTLLLPLSLNPDIEFNHKSLRLPDPTSPHHHSTKPATQQKKRVNLTTQIELLLRSLTSILNPPHPPRPPPSRVAAFTKRMCSLALHVPEKSSLAMLGVIGEVGKRNHGKISSMFRVGEKVGDGEYRLWMPEEEVDEEILVDDEEEEGREGEESGEQRKEGGQLGLGLGEGIEGIEERCNPFAATAWELDLLRRHYSPKVAGAAKEVVRGILGSAGEKVGPKGPVPRGARL